MASPIGAYDSMPLVPQQTSKAPPLPQSRKPIVVAVSGPGSCNDELDRLAFEVGREIARRGANLLCGGRGGVMERAAAGARASGGLTIGIMPGRSSVETPPNDSIELAIFTGLGQARNQVLVLSADVVIAIGGGWGTLSEIALAKKHEIPVVLLESWHLNHATETLANDLLTANSPEEAVTLAVDAAEAMRSKALASATSGPDQEVTDE